MVTYQTIVAGHTMQIAMEGEGFAAWTCLTCDPKHDRIILFGIVEWDDTPAITQAGQHASEHTLTPA